MPRFESTGTTTLSAAALSAVAPAMANRDVRFYLNGVQLMRSEKGAVRVTATNGHVLLTAVDPAGTWPEEVGPGPFLVPRDVVEQALKDAKKDAPVSFEFGAEFAGRVTAGGAEREFRCIDGRFPDWQALFPLKTPAPLPEGMAPVFAVDVLAVLVKSADAVKRRLGFRHSGIVMHPGGCADNAAVVRIGYRDDDTSPRVYGVAMPLRSQVSPEGMRALAQSGAVEGR